MFLLRYSHIRGTGLVGFVRKDRVSATLVEQLASAYFSLNYNCSLTQTSANTGVKNLMTSPFWVYGS
ncbi:hypothetical protein LPO01_04650 [Ligilactobacillus pobuzihii]|nr:hypothetical protein LPO01_04650 [Ligilactobacillus pobuzihii]